jgi:hypothetical protein
MIHGRPATANQVRDREKELKQKKVFETGAGYKKYLIIQSL